MRRNSQEFTLLDTAGLRKKAKVSDSVERYSTLRTLRSLQSCDVALVLVDATRGMSEQDAKIVGLAHDMGKGIVIVVNKWDAFDKDHKSAKEFTDSVRLQAKFAQYAPVAFVSALTGKRCPQLFELVKEVALERLRRVQTGRLNRLIERAVKRKSPGVSRGRQLKIFYASQVDVSPPRFVALANYPKDIHFSYLRFLKNAIRNEFGFLGTDLKLSLKKR